MLNARQAKEREDAVATQNLLMDIAFSTAIDTPLSSLVALRPYCVSIIANQVLFVSSLVSKLKAASFDPVGSSNREFNQVASTATPLQVQIAIVGCGSVGSKLIEKLIDSGRFHPTSITVVSRQPELLGRIGVLGVRCCRNLSDVLPDVDLMVIAVQPGQLTAVAGSAKGKLKPSCVVMSVCCGVHADKIANEFAHPLCLTTSINNEELSSHVTTWVSEDDVVRRCHAMAYASGKSFSVDKLTDEERAIYTIDSDRRVAVRSQQLKALSFPESIDFINRLIFILVVTTAARGIPFDTSMGMVFPQLSMSPLMTFNLPSNLKSDTPVQKLVQHCSLEGWSAVTNKPVPELILGLQDRFVQIISK